MSASRAVWFIAEGDPGEAWVLHTCSRGWQGCVNRRHLYLGDAAQNSRDMVAAGNAATFNAGEGNGNSKLSAVQVVEIRQRYALGGIRQKDLAKEFGVGRSTVSEIVNQRLWRQT